MAINLDDFVEQVRDANPIEKVLEESGIHLRGHGRLRTSTKHDSMKVRTDMQRVFWYSQNWNGDVFGWVMKEKGIEFMEALEILARRAHIELPKFQAVNESEVKRTRATADVFSVAASVFHRWLEGMKRWGSLRILMPWLMHMIGHGPMRRSMNQWWGFRVEKLRINIRI